MPQVKAGKLRALAVTSAKRATAIPDLPTVAEAGVRGYEAIGWFGLLAPAATPHALVEKISRDANAVLANPDVHAKMLALGAEPSGDTPREFGRFIHADQAKWTKLMKERGIVVEY